MAGEGRVRCSKQRQEIGGSSSSQGPSTHPKKLAKRARPSTLREESTHEDSPPRGGTPESPGELECLKIRPPIAHTNQEVVNYSKEDPMNLITICNKPCFSLPKGRGTDETFWTFFIKTGT
jgi:hypothetical protein